MLVIKVSPQISDTFCVYQKRSVGTYIHVLVLSIYSKYILCVRVLQHSVKKNLVLQATWPDLGLAAQYT